ncbi:MAG: hypothetical protein K1X94_28020 [Sandaracinaceae bacterium]|nr:hypothetical protein [Sandaracinaceae bacterium]
MTPTHPPPASRIFAPWLLLVALGAAAGGPALARAQDVDPEAVREVRELGRCIDEHHVHLDRLVHLIADAEARTTSSDPAVARDAREAITALVHRAHDVRAHLELCIREAQIPGPDTETHVVREGPAAGSAEAHVSEAGGTVQEVHSAEPIGTHVRVVSGERVDGRGTVPHEDLRRAVRAAGSAIDRCYETFLDRASAREGNVEISFAAVDGTIREAAVESVGPFDGAFRTCVVSAVSSMQLHHTSGRTVFAYVISVGGS